MIPALDLRGGALVRLERGDYARETVYGRDPAAVAARFAAAGAPRLHVVDLDGAREGRPCNTPAIRDVVVAARGVPVQAGGGVRSLGAVEALLDLGVDRVILGTAALEDPELLRSASHRFPGRVVLGLDARHGRVAVRGWLETSELSAREVLARFEDLPLAAVLHTDISRDGTLEGPNLEATVELARATPLPVLASGGVGSLQDLLALARTGAVHGAVVGKALYTGRIDLEEALREVAAC